MTLLKQRTKKYLLVLGLNKKFDFVFWTIAQKQSALQAGEFESFLLFAELPFLRFLYKESHRQNQF